MADQISPFTPTMQAQLEQLLQSQVDRNAGTTPIHQAAMAMASRMAPGYAQSAMTGPTAPPPGGPSTTGGPTTTGTTSTNTPGPGIATTVGLTALTSLLKAGTSGKSNPLLAALKKLLGIGGGPGGGGGGGGDSFGAVDNSGWLPNYDPFGANDPGNFNGNPSDPSGGTQIGPGMQAFYDALNNAGGDSGENMDDYNTPGAKWGG